MRGEQLKAGNDKSHRPQNILFVVFIHRKYLRTLLYFKRAFYTMIIWQKLFKKMDNLLSHHNFQKICGSIFLFFAP